MIIFGCGGPDYPDEIPPTKTETQKEVDDLYEGIDTSFEMVTDTFNFISTEAKYYQQIRPILVSSDGNSIFIDGNEFRILQQMDTIIDGTTIIGYKVQGISGLYNNINEIAMAIKDDQLQEMAIPPLGIFSKNTPDKWILNEEQSKANKEKIVKTDRTITTHEVGTGQNITIIARMHNMSVQELIELNRNKLTKNGKISSKIYPGQKLKVYAD